MMCNPPARALQRRARIAALSACLGVVLAAPLLAAQRPDSVAVAGAAHDPQANPQAAVDDVAAQRCLQDLRAFSARMQSDGDWLYGFGYGYGYPMYGYSYGPGLPLPANEVGGTPAGSGFLRARPGYEVRTLIAAANILAQRGEQQACEESLASSQDIYKDYEEDLRASAARRSDHKGWRSEQIAAALPVTGSGAAFRSSDQLVGTAVVNPQSDALGSVSDVVLSPQSGRIAYLVISRGGVFGIDAKYVPVPWEDFKSTLGTSLLVLDSTKPNMDRAPQLKAGQFSRHGKYDEQSKNIDEYWKEHVAR